MKKFPSCRCLITSRIVGYNDVEFHSGEDWMKERRAIEAGDLASLGAGDAGEFIAATPSARVLYLAPFNDAQVEQFSRNWFRRYESDPSKAGEKSGDFIKDIRLAPAVLELARTPNLLTLMALIYYAEADLPNGRAMLYQKIAEAYLETIDRFRKLGFEQAFNHNDRFNFLSRVAFEMQQRRSELDSDNDSAAGEILISRGRLEEMLAKTVTGADAMEIIDEFLGYIGRRTGLLIPRGIGEGDEEQYAFAHLSFQEYFAASHLESGIVHDPDWSEVKRNPKSELSLENLRKLTGDPAWLEVFYLFFEIVSDSDRSGKWAPRLIEKELFPEDSNPIAAMPLLSRILADPHCSLDETARRDQIARCWRCELRRHRELADSTDGRFRAFRPEITVNLTGETSAFGGLAGEVWEALPERAAQPYPGRLIDAAIALCDLSRGGNSRFSPDSLKKELVSVIEEERLPAAGRALAGHLMGSLGDPRPGVTWRPEEPQGGFRCVPLAGVEISIYPVTNDQYRPFVEAGGYGERAFWTEAGWKWKEKEKIEGPEDSGGKFQNPNHPRVGVSWYEAVAYCRWLSKELGREVRLPADKEWVAAVNPRGDCVYPWGNEDDRLEERVNFAPDWKANLGSTSAVGTYPKGSTPEGLSDVAGNVWEWSLSKPDDSAETEKDNIEGNDNRVLRGGSWNLLQGYLACSARIRNSPVNRGRDGGFRVVFAPSS